MKLEGKLDAIFEEIVSVKIEKEHNSSQSRNKIIQNIESQLKPVLTSLTTIMVEVTETIVDGKQNHQELITRLSNMFIENKCSISFDESGKYTSSENPASIQFIDGKLQLKVDEKFEKNEDLSLNNEFLKELIHELGALLLINQLKDEIAVPILSQGILDIYKSQLILPGSKIILTHILDTVLLVLIRDMKKNSNFLNDREQVLQ